MKLKEGFITHQSGGEHITVAAGVEAFNGMIRSNSCHAHLICITPGKAYAIPKQICKKRATPFGVAL